jgi:hypothetical protein
MKPKHLEQGITRIMYEAMFEFLTKNLGQLAGYGSKNNNSLARHRP